MRGVARRGAASSLVPAALLFSTFYRRVTGLGASTLCAMPKELPPVDVEHPSDLDFMIQTIQSYALDIGRERLRARGRGAAHLEPMLEQAVGRVRIQAC